MEHKHKQNKQYNSRKEWMQVEFDFSGAEVEGLDKFLSGREGEMVSDFLRNVIDTKDLNGKQKVIISFIMGRFTQEIMQEQLKSIEKSMVEMRNQPPEVGG